jgi:hypothetical protein
MRKASVSFLVVALVVELASRTSRLPASKKSTQINYSPTTSSTPLLASSGKEVTPKNMNNHQRTLFMCLVRKKVLRGLGDAGGRMAIKEKHNTVLQIIK